MPESATAERAEEDRQLFDLDKHRSQTRQQLLQCKGALAMKAKGKRRAELCLQEVQTLPDTTTTYKAVGRCAHSTSIVAAAARPATSLTLCSPAAV